MPTRVTDLRRIEEFEGNEDILVLSPTNELKKIRTENFIGRGSYNSTDEPTTAHPVEGRSYRVGDTYIWNNGASSLVYQWEGIPTHNWIFIGDLAGAKIHTQGSIGHDNYEEANTLIDTPDISHGSFYLQGTTGKLFGPKSDIRVVNSAIVAGIDFNPLDRTNWIGFRDKAEFVVQGGNNFVWQIPVEGVALPVDHGVKVPHQGDTLKVVLDDPHGGWIYSWDDGAYTASVAGGGTEEESWIIGWSTLPRIHARYPREIVGDDVPVHDDNLYISGDGFLDTLHQIRYSRYTSGIGMVIDPETSQPWENSAVGARLRQVWGTPTNASTGGTIILTNGAEVLTNPYYPSRVGAELGQLMIYRGIMFGPFVTGQATDIEAWPIQYQLVASKTILRSVASIADVDAMATASSIDWQAEGVTVREGDTLRVNITNNGSSKIYEFGPVEVEYESGDHTTSLQWGTRRNITTNAIHNSPLDSQPLRDDDVYSSGDFIISNTGDGYGPYVEGEATDAGAWPLSWTVNQAPELIITDDARNGTRHRLGIEDGSIYVEEIA